MQYAIKELARFMQKPTERDWENLKRLARYIKDHMRVVIHFELQDEPTHIDVFGDSDYAGCALTRKSTTCTVVMYGSHPLRQNSNTQAVVGLATGENEYYSVVKASSVGLGVKAMFADYGHDIKVRIHTDSVAAKAISNRRGLGKVRHVDVKFLWVQQRTLNGDIEVLKADGETNIADIGTKHLDKKRLEMLLNRASFFYSQGRSGIAKEVIGKG